MVLDAGVNFEISYVFSVFLLFPMTCRARRDFENVQFITCLISYLTCMFILTVSNSNIMFNYIWYI